MTPAGHPERSRFSDVERISPGQWSRLWEIPIRLLLALLVERSGQALGPLVKARAIGTTAPIRDFKLKEYEDAFRQKTEGAAEGNRCSRVLSSLALSPNVPSYDRGAVAPVQLESEEAVVVARTTASSNEQNERMPVWFATCGLV